MRSRNRTTIPVEPATLCEILYICLHHVVYIAAHYHVSIAEAHGDTTNPTQVVLRENMFELSAAPNHTRYTRAAWKFQCQYLMATLLSTKLA